MHTIRIGVIAPYRAQANLLSRLNDSWVPKPNVVEIQIGTIHGFQLVGFPSSLASTR